MPPGKQHQQGLSMIEVLVAVAVLSIGLLGTAALQVQSKRANLGSVERTLASMLVNDMFERMRANPNELNAYLSALNKDQNVGVTSGTEPTGCMRVNSTDTNDCTPAQLAAWDVWEWEQRLIGASEVVDSGGTDINTGGLVLPLACMTGPAGGGEGEYVITINWRGHSEFTDGSIADPCGANASGRYNGDAGTGTLRRMVSISSYLND
jgi:type IV pilus assembly protein PilV